MKNKKNISSIGILFICSILTQSCEKIGESHYEKVVRKTSEYDEAAYTGDWLQYKTVTWDKFDQASETSDNLNLSITKRFWKTDNEKRSISLFHELICGAILSYVIFQDEASNDTFEILNWAGTPTEMYFKIYEHPTDTNISRIDRYYKPRL